MDRSPGAKFSPKTSSSYRTLKSRAIGNGEVRGMFEEASGPARVSSRMFLHPGPEGFFNHSHLSWR